MGHGACSRDAVYEILHTNGPLCACLNANLCKRHTNISMYHYSSSAVHRFWARICIPCSCEPLAIGLIVRTGMHWPAVSTCTARYRLLRSRLPPRLTDAWRHYVVFWARYHIGQGSFSPVLVLDVFMRSGTSAVVETSTN